MITMCELEHHAMRIQIVYDIFFCVSHKLSTMIEVRLSAGKKTLPPRECTDSCKRASVW